MGFAGSSLEISLEGGSDGGVVRMTTIVLLMMMVVVTMMDVILVRERSLSGLRRDQHCKGRDWRVIDLILLLEQSLLLLLLQRIKLVERRLKLEVCNSIARAA